MKRHAAKFLNVAQIVFTSDPCYNVFILVCCDAGSSGLTGLVTKCDLLPSILLNILISFWAALHFICTGIENIIIHDFPPFSPKFISLL